MTEMSFIKETEDSDVINQEEFMVSLRKIREENARFPGFRYFADLAEQWYRQIRTARINSSVVILGCGVPEELIMASGQIPFRILGGNRQSCLWSDELVPRDADPVSRSILGYVRCLTEHSPCSGDILYIVSSGSDSMRKIAYHLIRECKKVLIIDVPPVRDSKSSLKMWEEQLLYMTRMVSDHVKGTITASSVRAAVRETTKARIALHEFSMMAPVYDRVLSASARILIQNSYYYASDLNMWTFRLRKLMTQITEQAQHMALTEQTGPGVLLTGSPIYFPNDKIPRLLSDAGLRIWQQTDASENIQAIIPKIGKCGRNIRKIIEAVAGAWYSRDASSAYMKNETMRKRIRTLCHSHMVEGVVFHVLKGQIDQDFELAYYDILLEEMGIPVFRLETDYQFQDVEQLRIRMEAFAEMLNQNRYRNQKEAV